MKTENLSQPLAASPEKTASENNYFSLLPDDSDHNRHVHKLRVQLRKQQKLLEKAFNRYVYGKAKGIKGEQGYVYPQITSEKLHDLIHQICVLRNRIVQLGDEISYLTGEGL